MKLYHNTLFYKLIYVLFAVQLSEAGYNIGPDCLGFTTNPSYGSVIASQTDFTIIFDFDHPISLDNNPIRGKESYLFWSLANEFELRDVTRSNETHTIKANLIDFDANQSGTQLTLIFSGQNIVSGSLYQLIYSTLLHTTYFEIPISVKPLYFRTAEADPISSSEAFGNDQWCPLSEFLDFYPPLPKELNITVIPCETFICSWEIKIEIDIIPREELFQIELASVKDSNGFEYDLDEAIQIDIDLKKAFVKADSAFVNTYVPQYELAYSIEPGDDHPMMSIPSSIIVDTLNYVRENSDICRVCYWSVNTCKLLNNDYETIATTGLGRKVDFVCNSEVILSVIPETIENTSIIRWMKEADYIECGTGSKRNEVCPECGPLYHTFMTSKDALYSLYTINNVEYHHQMSIDITSNSGNSTFELNLENSHFTNMEYFKFEFEKFLSIDELLYQLERSHLLIPNITHAYSPTAFVNSNAHYWAFYSKEVDLESDDCDNLNHSQMSFFEDTMENPFCSRDFGHCLNNQIGHAINNFTFSTTSAANALRGTDANGVPFGNFDQTQGKLSLNFNLDFQTIKTKIVISGKTSTSHRKLLEPNLIEVSTVIEKELTSVISRITFHNTGDGIGNVIIEPNCFNSGIQYNAQQHILQPGQVVTANLTFLLGPEVNGNVVCHIRVKLPKPIFWSHLNKNFEKVANFVAFFGCTSLTPQDAFLGASLEDWINNPDTIDNLGPNPLGVIVPKSWTRQSRSTFIKRITYSIPFFSNAEKIPVVSEVRCTSDSGFIQRERLNLQLYSANETRSVSYTLEGNGIGYEGAELNCELVVEIESKTCWRPFGKKLVYPFKTEAPYDVCRSIDSTLEPSLMIPLEQWDSRNNDKDMIYFELSQGWKSQGKDFTMSYEFELSNMGAAEGLFGVTARCNSTTLMYSEKSTKPELIQPNESKLFTISFISKDTLHKPNVTSVCDVIVSIKPSLYFECWSDKGKVYSQLLYLSLESEPLGLFGIGQAQSGVLLGCIIVVIVGLIVAVTVLLIRKRLNKGNIWGGMNQADAEIMNKKYINETRIYSEINRVTPPSTPIKNKKKDDSTDSLSEIKSGITVVENVSGNRKTVIDEDVSDEGNVYVAPENKETEISNNVTATTEVTVSEENEMFKDFYKHGLEDNVFHTAEE